MLTSRRDLFHYCGPKPSVVSQFGMLLGGHLTDGRKYARPNEIHSMYIKLNNAVFANNGAN